MFGIDTGSIPLITTALPPQFSYYVLPLVAFTIAAATLIARKSMVSTQAPVTKIMPAITLSAQDEALLRQKLEAKEVKVSKLMIYPIKSCRGTSVSEANYTPSGLENDRKWCIIDPVNHKILTARAIPKMVLISPRIIVDPNDPHGGRLEVAFPSDANCETFLVPLRPTDDVLKQWATIDDLRVHSFTNIDGYVAQPHPSSVAGPTLCSTVLSRFLGRSVQLAYKGPRLRPAPPTWSEPALKAHVDYHDAYPLLVASMESLVGVRDYVKQWWDEQGITAVDNWDPDSLVIERFRPNIVFEGAGIPFAEDMWKEITTSDHSSKETGQFSLVSKCTRCMLPNIDPDTGARNIAIPSKPLKRFRTGLDPTSMDASCFGCNAVPAASGKLRVGDSVAVNSWGIV